jgi:hypothetical protein
MTHIIATKWLGGSAMALALVMAPLRVQGEPADAGDIRERGCPAPDAPAVWRGAFERLGPGQQPRCPAPTRRAGEQCVLDGDVTLAATLVLESFTHLNCRGHRILPATPGTAPPSTTASIPEVAIALDRDTVGVKIQDCLIGGTDGDLANGFDFGIFVRDSKSPRQSSTKIQGNTINARHVGIGISRSDHVLVEGNHVNVMNPGSAGIHIGGDSDGNRVTGNTVKRWSSAVPTPRKPSPGFPVAPNATAMGILVSTPRANAVNQSIIAGVLSQTAQVADCLPLNEDNVIEGNSVDMNRDPVTPAGVVIQTGLIVMDFAVGTEVHGNLVENAVRGITLNTSATPATLARSLAGVCVGGSGAGRPCGSAADCFIPPPRYTDTTAGACDGATSTSPSNDPVPHDTVFEDNLIVGSFEGASIQTGIGLIIRGNTIRDSETNGISLGGHALSSATLVSRNVIENQRTGLTLVHPTIPRFGVSNPGEFHAEVTLNDITGSTVQAIAVSSLAAPPGYFLPTELSSNARGNYWGRTCDDDDGFREFGQPGADSPVAFVIDSHPYGASVATAPSALLPPACPQ